ncbi:MAG: chemotaxis protein CheD [Lachnospiraceae bacterium]|nr:chemotaxis protein CheD [Lachnospiraceae bacterium]MBR1875695.1 chemotaxis protein CheD [Lachnospiraceae bacterium]
MAEMIKVGMADLKLCISPNSITTLGLGSCVGVAIRDTGNKIGGLAHVMLPDSKEIKNNTNVAKFADTGVEELVRQMEKAGARRKMMVAKIAGGAQMFGFQNSASPLMKVGDRNVLAVKKKLKELGIPLKAEDCGLNYGRTVEFYPETGDFVIKAVGKPVSKI